MQNRHPALEIKDLKGLDKAVFEVMARSGATSPTQNEISSKLGREAASQSTVSRSIARLIELGLVIKEGERRTASFRLTREAKWFSLPAHARPRVAFDLSRITDYVKGADWLPADIAARLAVASPPVNRSLDAATFSREIAERFMIDLSWASSSMEGNTYSLLETEVLLKYGEAAAGHSAEEATMILNHKAAISWMVENISSLSVDADTALRLHALLMRGLVRADNAGAVRRHAVGVTNTAYEPSDDPRDLAFGLGELCAAAGARSNPFEASFALLAGLAYLQVFADGNKRLGRVMSSIPLLKAGLAPMSFIGVDRASYSVGITSWYELADPVPLARAIADGYEISAPAYAVASAVRRVPRSVEIRERKRTSEVILDYVKAFVDGDRTSALDFAAAAFAHLPDEDRDWMAAYVSEVISSLHETSGPAYGIPHDVAEAFVAARDQVTPK